MSYVTHIQRWRTGDAIDRRNAGPARRRATFPKCTTISHALHRDVDRDALAAGPSTLWRYHALLPVEDPSRCVSLGEGWTPLLPMPRLREIIDCGEVWAKDEGRNPSGTFKDRGASVAVSRARELGITNMIHNSSGNAAGAWALYAARAGLRCINLVPDDVLPASLAQSLLGGR